jgi:hypothetical protein
MDIPSTLSVELTHSERRETTAQSDDLSIESPRPICLADPEPTNENDEEYRSFTASSPE